MRRAWRLRANEDFQRVRRHGRTWAHPLLVLAAAPGPDPLGPTRLGVSTGKRLGGAVVRNRVRRRVREAVRGAYAELDPGWDLVFIARSAAAEAPFAEINQAVRQLLARAGLLVVAAP
jgi:ribonuclease P protein component